MRPKIRQIEVKILPRRFALADPVGHAELMWQITDPQDLNEALLSVSADHASKRMAEQILDYAFGPRPGCATGATRTASKPPRPFRNAAVAVMSYEHKQPNPAHQPNKNTN